MRKLHFCKSKYTDSHLLSPHSCGRQAHNGPRAPAHTRGAASSLMGPCGQVASSPGGRCISEKSWFEGETLSQLIWKEEALLAGDERPCP